MNSGHVQAQKMLLAKHGPIAEKRAQAYDFTTGQRKLFVEMVSGYLANHAGQEPPNGYDQLAALAKRQAK
ncbi:Uncharacterised protein [uncultured archaeon]|nr:Uncharacterised protein [uncultured archaeon]